MKLLSILPLLGSVAAYQPMTMMATRPVGGTTVRLSRSVETVPSAALPYGRNRAPATLGGVPGDAGFDPVFFSNNGFIAAYFRGLLGTKNAGVDSFTWLREAELMNGRNAMMGVVGMIVPGLLGSTASPLEATGEDCFPVFLTMAWMEWFRINNIREAGDSYKAGDMQKWGQGEGERFNPFGLNYSEEEYANIQLSEIKHCRLAMIGFMGLYFQAANSGENIVIQLGRALAYPEYGEKIGNFIPEGI